MLNKTLPKLNIQKYGQNYIAYVHRYLKIRNQSDSFMLYIIFFITNMHFKFKQIMQKFSRENPKDQG